MKSLKKAFGLPTVSKDDDTHSNTESPPAQPLSQPSLNPGHHGQFPDTFSIYLSRQTKERTTKTTDYFYLVLESEGKKIQPLNIISFDKRTTEHQLTLFSDTKCSSAPLALAGVEKSSFSIYHNIALPARNDSVDGLTNNTIRLDTHDNPKTKDIVYRFTLDVGRGQHQHPETFEWRTGTDTQSPQQQKNKAFKCWLVRLASGPVPGEELVATWVEGNTPRTAAKLGTFQFEGSATTSYLGSYWSLGAVVSLLHIVQLRWMKLAAAARARRAAKKFTVAVIMAAGTGSGGPSVGI